MESTILNPTIPETRLIDIDFSIINDLILCPLIPHVMINPVQCLECQQHFCCKCLKKSLLNDIRCPFCRKNMNKIGPPQKSILALIENTRISCMNKNNGCTEIMKIQDYLTHESKCSYEEMVCINYMCNLTILKRDFIQHQAFCDNQILNCKFCGFQSIRKNMHKHLEKTICWGVCKYCYQEMSKDLLKDHKKHCLEKIYICQICRSKLKKKDIDHHNELCVVDPSNNILHNAIITYLHPPTQNLEVNTREYGHRSNYIRRNGMLEINQHHIADGMIPNGQIILLARR